MSRAKPKVWYASAARNVNAQLPIRAVEYQDYLDKKLPEGRAAAVRENVNDRLDAFKSGRLLHPVTFLSEWALGKDERSPKAPSPMMSFGGTPMVTAEACALLETHDIGPVRFHPIRVLDAKREAPLWPDCPEVHALNVGTVKRGLDVAATNNAEWPIVAPRKGHTPTGLTHYSVRGREDDNLAFSPVVLDGPDLWVDDQLEGEIFLSDRLAKALTKAGLSRGWGLRRCRIVG